MDIGEVDLLKMCPVLSSDCLEELKGTIDPIYNDGEHGVQLISSCLRLSEG